MLKSYLLAALGFVVINSVSATAERHANHGALLSITADDLMHHVERLADDSFEGREAGSQGGRAAGGYLVRYFEKYGLQPAGDDGGYFQWFGQGYRNILGLLEGSDPDLKHEVIVIGAHYDHVGLGTRRNSRGEIGRIHNGADDNASGTAGLLETIEAFLSLGHAPRRSILFALWDGEEKGLLGSKHWVAYPTLSLDRVRFTINCDMIGRLGDEGVEIYGTRTSPGLRRLVSECNEELSLDLDFTWEIKGNSDHWPFYQRGIPFLMLHTRLHDEYHKPSDDAELINQDGIQRVARLLFNIAHELSDRDETGAFRSAAGHETPRSKTTLEQPLAKRPPRLGVWWDLTDARTPGVGVARVVTGSAAENGGLRAGDRIVTFAGKDVSNKDQLVSEILFARARVEVMVTRAGQDEPVKLAIELSQKPVRVGITWREDTAEPGTVLLTQVIPGSPAFHAGLEVRDRIYLVDGQPYEGAAELKTLLTTLPSPVELVVERRGKLRSVQLDVPPAE